MKDHRWIVRGLSPPILRLILPLRIHHDLDQVVHILSKVLLITNARMLGGWYISSYFTSAGCPAWLLLARSLLKFDNACWVVFWVERTVLFFWLIITPTSLHPKRTIVFFLWQISRGDRVAFGWIRVDWSHDSWRHVLGVNHALRTFVNWLQMQLVWANIWDAGFLEWIVMVLYLVNTWRRFFVWDLWPLMARLIWRQCPFSADN